MIWVRKSSKRWISLFTVFSLVESKAKAFCWLSLWTSRKKVLITFYGTAFLKVLVPSSGCGRFNAENTAFLSDFPPQLKHFIDYPSGTSKRKVSTIFYNTAFSFLKVFDWQEAVRREFLPYEGRPTMRGLPCSVSWRALAYGVRGWVIPTLLCSLGRRFSLDLL